MIKKIIKKLNKIIYISKDGHIYDENKKQYEEVKNIKGYLTVKIKGYTYLVHEIVAEAYHKEAIDKIRGTNQKCHIHHLDGNKFNNDFNNLLPMKEQDHINYHKKVNFKIPDYAYYKIYAYFTNELNLKNPENIVYSFLYNICEQQKEFWDYDNGYYLSRRLGISLKNVNDSLELLINRKLIEVENKSFKIYRIVDYEKIRNEIEKSKGA